MHKKWLLAIIILTTVCACNQDLEKEASEKEIAEENAFHQYLRDSVTMEQVIKRDLGYTSTHSLLNKLNFEDSVLSLYKAIELNQYGLPYSIFRNGMIGFLSLKEDGYLSEKNLLSIIDFTQSSCNKRFYTIDLDEQEVVFNTYVSHGRGSGGDMPTKFSNVRSSYQSSLGFYVTAETYTGSKGYSLRLEGMEEGINEKLRERAVVMHDAEYVSEDWIKKYGRLGRSQGCPALPKEISKEVIDTIKDRTAIFAYYDDSKYLKASNYLNLEKLLDRWE